MIFDEPCPAPQNSIATTPVDTRVRCTFALNKPSLPNPAKLDSVHGNLIIHILSL
jgi:hypothetical protein